MSLHGSHSKDMQHLNISSLKQLFKIIQATDLNNPIGHNLFYFPLHIITRLGTYEDIATFKC